MLLESLQTARSLRSVRITRLRRSYGPLRHPLAFPPTSRCHRLYGFLFPPISRRGEEGFSSCLAHPCHRAAAATPPECPVASVSLRRAMLPSPHEERLGLWNSVSRLRLHSLVAARCLAHHPFDGFVDRFSGFGFPPPDYPSYRVLTFTLVGLFPTECASLRWTHLHAGLARRTVMAMFQQQPFRSGHNSTNSTAFIDLAALTA
jgi:hypothetical protein